MAGRFVRYSSSDHAALRRQPGLPLPRARLPASASAPRRRPASAPSSSRSPIRTRRARSRELLRGERPRDASTSTSPWANAAAGDFGIACLPGREAEFREGVERAIAYAAVLGNERVNCIAGKAPPGDDPALLRAHAPRQPAATPRANSPAPASRCSSSPSTPSTCRASSCPAPPTAPRCWRRPARANCGAAVRHLPRGDDGRRSVRRPRALRPGDPPRPVRGRAGAPRAGHGTRGHRRLLRATRRPRLRGLDRGGVPSLEGARRRRSAGSA